MRMSNKGQAIIKNILRFIGVFVFLHIISGCSRPKTVLLTGYWPPTNEMLVPFSQDTELNPAGWQGENWQDRGYDVVAYFPTFPGGTKANPKGIGDFEVDYQDTWADFHRVVRKHRPEAIICYGLGHGPWEIECNARHLEVWHNDFLAPTQPGCFCGFSKTYKDGEAVPLTLPAEAIREAVTEAVPELKVWADTDGDPGDFLCNYLAFLAADYQIREKRCKVSGFIHVGPKVDLETAKKAHEVTLKTVISHIQ